jgi:hypothetical protein
MLKKGDMIWFDTMRHGWKKRNKISSDPIMSYKFKKEVRSGQVILYYNRTEQRSECERMSGED